MVSIGKTCRQHIAPLHRAVYQRLRRLILAHEASFPLKTLPFLDPLARRASGIGKIPVARLDSDAPRSRLEDFLRLSAPLRAIARTLDAKIKIVLCGIKICHSHRPGILLMIGRGDIDLLESR